VRRRTCCPSVVSVVRPLANAPGWPPARSRGLRPGNRRHPRPRTLPPQLLPCPNSDRLPARQRGRAVSSRDPTTRPRAEPGPHGRREDISGGAKHTDVTSRVASQRSFLARESAHFKNKFVDKLWAMPSLSRPIPFVKEAAFATEHNNSPGDRVLTGCRPVASWAKLVRGGEGYRLHGLQALPRFGSHRAKEVAQCRRIGTELTAAPLTGTRTVLTLERGVAQSSARRASAFSDLSFSLKRHPPLSRSGPGRRASRPSATRRGRLHGRTDAKVR
jgi:hypothetical protein